MLCTQSSVGAPGRDEIETPYLQLVMTTLWERELGSGSSMLRLETLHRLGGAASIVRSHMDGVLAGLPDAEQDLAADIFHHLVTPSGTKIVHRVSDLAAYAGHDRDAVLRLVNDLISRDQRILRPIPAADGNAATRVEIFHDVLAPAIVEWRTARDARRLRADKLEAERIAARERRRARTFRALAIAAATGLIIAIVAFAVTEIHRTDVARAGSDSRELAAKASVYLGTDELRLGSLLAVAAHQISSTADAAHALVTASVRTFAMSSYVRTSSGIGQLAISPDGRSVVGGENGTAQIVDLWEHRRREHPCPAGRRACRRRLRPERRARCLGRREQSSGSLDVSARHISCTFQVNAVETLAFDAAGQLLASGGDDGRIRLWILRRADRSEALRGAGPSTALSSLPTATRWRPLLVAQSCSSTRPPGGSSSS